jgi:hypothetical protein
MSACALLRSTYEYKGIIGLPAASIPTACLHEYLTEPKSPHFLKREPEEQKDIAFSTVMAWYASELDALSAWDVRQPIPASTLAPVLSAPPFIPIPSLVNARDIGAVPGSAIAPNRIYRCGVLDAAGRDPQATIWLGNCVTRVFDLRRADERQTARDPSVLGVKNVWRETEGEELKLSVAEFAQGAGVPAWARQLMSVVHTYKPIFREVLEHVRDRPTEPFLFHCTGTYASHLLKISISSPPR